MEKWTSRDLLHNRRLPAGMPPPPRSVNPRKRPSDDRPSAERPTAVVRRPDANRLVYADGSTGVVDCTAVPLAPRPHPLAAAAAVARPNVIRPSPLSTTPLVSARPAPVIPARPSPSLLRFPVPPSQPTVFIPDPESPLEKEIQDIKQTIATGEGYLRGLDAQRNDPDVNLPLLLGRIHKLRTRILAQHRSLLDLEERQRRQVKKKLTPPTPTATAAPAVVSKAPAFRTIAPTLIEQTPADRLAAYAATSLPVSRTAPLNAEAWAQQVARLHLPPTSQFPPYQAAGVEFLLTPKPLFFGRMARGGLLGDDTGLGKTQESCAAALLAQLDDPTTKILVILPSRPILQQWKDCLLRWFGLRDDEVRVYLDSDRTQTPLAPTVRVLLVTMNTFADDAQYYSNGYFCPDRSTLINEPYPSEETIMAADPKHRAALRHIRDRRLLHHGTSLVFAGTQRWQVVVDEGAELRYEKRLKRPMSVDKLRTWALLYLQYLGLVAMTVLNTATPFNNKDHGFVSLFYLVSQGAITSLDQLDHGGLARWCIRRSKTSPEVRQQNEAIGRHLPTATVEHRVVLPSLEEEPLLQYVEGGLMDMLEAAMDKKDMHLACDMGSVMAALMRNRQVVTNPCILVRANQAGTAANPLTLDSDDEEPVAADASDPNAWQLKADWSDLVTYPVTAKEELVMEAIRTTPGPWIIMTSFVPSVARYKALIQHFFPAMTMVIEHHGKIPQKQRQRELDEFKRRDNGTNKVFIGTNKAGGLGLNLDIAPTLIIAGIVEWTPSLLHQVNGRIDRLSVVPDRVVQTIIVSYDCTLEQYIMENYLMMKRERAVECMGRGEEKLYGGKEAFNVDASEYKKTEAFKVTAREDMLKMFRALHTFAPARAERRAALLEE